MIRFLCIVLWLLSLPAFAAGGMMPDIVNAQQPASSGSCTAATNYLARTSGGNEGGNSANITTLICGLVTDGVITGNLSGAAGCGSYLNGLYILAQQNASDAVLNLCGTSFTVSPSTATFTAYQGYSAFPTNGVDTGFNPTSSSGSLFTQNNATMGAWAYNTPAAASTAQLGTGSGAGSSVLAMSYASGSQYYCYIGYGGGSITAAIPPNAVGLYSCDKSSSVGSNVYYNGILQLNDTGGTASLANNDIFIGGSGGGFPQPQRPSPRHISALPSARR